MKFCLLVTVASDIFVKGKSNTLHLLCRLSFLYAKGVHLVRLSIEVPYQPFSKPPGIPIPPANFIFYTNLQPPAY